MTLAESTSFPAEALTAGHLRLSGSDAMGPNPWTKPRPEAKDYRLTALQLEDKNLAATLRKSESNVRQFPYRFISSFVVPLSAFAAAYTYLIGDFSFATPPTVEWVIYLATSLVLGGVAAHFQTRQHAADKVDYDDQLGVADRRVEFRTSEREWYADQRRRTLTGFWLKEIPRTAAEKGISIDAAFAQEVAKLFVAWTWNVKLNQRAHDYGVDIFGQGKEGSAVIQCRHAADTGPRSSDIRDLAGSRHAFAADYGLLISIHPPQATPQNEFFSDKGQLEFWHLGHVLEQCMALYKQRTGHEPPEDPSRSQFLDDDGAPIARNADEKVAAE